MGIDKLPSVEEGGKEKCSVSDAVEEISPEEYNRLVSNNTNQKKFSRKQEPRVMNIGSLCTYQLPEKYASSLYSLAWMQAVKSKPQQVFVESISDSKQSSSSLLSSGEEDDDDADDAISLESPVREGCGRILIDLDNYAHAEEGNDRVFIDLEIDDVDTELIVDADLTVDAGLIVDDDSMVDAELIVDDDSMVDDNMVSEKENEKLEDGEIDLASVVVESSKEELVVESSKEELEDTLMEDSELLVILVELETITAVKAEKSFGEVCTRLHDLLLNLQQVLSDCSDSDNGAWKYISFAALQAINSAFLSLSSNQKVQHKSIHQRLLSYVKRNNPAMFLPAQMREIEIMVQDLDESPALLTSIDNKKKDLIGVSETLFDKKLETLKLDSAPLLDLQKHRVVDNPPTIEIEDKTIHPPKTHAVKQNIVPSLIVMPERIPSPTLLKGSDNGIRDVGGDVSRINSASMPPSKLRDPRLRSAPREVIISRKHKPVKDPVTDIPVVKRQMVSSLNSRLDYGSGHQQLHGNSQGENIVTPMKNGSLQIPTDAQKSRETLQTRSQKADETGKIFMKHRDPSYQKVLQSRSQKDKSVQDQFVTGSMPSSLGAPPNISGQVTSKQNNTIVWGPFSQPSSQGHYSDMDVAQFEGYSEEQIATIQKERTRRIREQKELFSARKLSLVLDLDHTILNSARFVDLDPAHEELLRKREEQERGNPNRLLFCVPHMGLWTKLRPGIWNFLEKASKLFELHLNTMGNKMYAAEMAKVLDPRGVLFAGRIISRGDEDDHLNTEERFSKYKDLQGVLGLESNVIIMDDTVRVWPHYKLNLIAVERYIYFPCSRRQFGLPGPSLLEINHDERHENGTIASTLAVMERIHEAFFSQNSLHEADVRNILCSQQRKILSGCRILFSRIVPIGYANPHKHPLWQIAQQFGADCTNQIDENVTHVVSNAPGTDKVYWALACGKFVVSPGWVEASAFLYRRANEKDYAIVKQ